MGAASIAVKNDWFSLIIFLVACFAVAALGSLATTPEIPGWYSTLSKPSWNPPNWLFGPVWTTLYAMMAVAAWLVWRRAGWSSAITLFIIQLILNLAWSFIFFKFHSPGLAFIEIVLLWATIVATTVKFSGISQSAALLFIPYLLWVTFAAALNFSIWRLNS
jgi:tryptophan-rich sensory protein